MLWTKALQEKKKTEDVALQRVDETDKLKEVLDQAIDAVVSIDKSNIVTYFNAAAEHLWGYKSEEVVGQNVSMLVPSNIRQNHDSYVNANRSSNVNKIVGTSREVQLERKDGRQVWANLSLSKIGSGDNARYTAFVKDITEEKQARDIIQQTLEQALATLSSPSTRTTTSPSSMRQLSAFGGIRGRK
tara:strand:- start:18392 stop:18952 length:561 start_codon:yes stop_codon:yes gene_type:complete